jgi:hypothetical protein
MKHTFHLPDPVQFLKEVPRVLDWRGLAHNISENSLLQLKAASYLEICASLGKPL